MNDNLVIRKGISRRVLPYTRYESNKNQAEFTHSDKIQSDISTLFQMITQIIIYHVRWDKIDWYKEFVSSLMLNFPSVD
jgi:hypothetical protein